MAVKNRWYISDWHLFHNNIIEYGERPFDSVKQMHEALITYHNELVKPQDHYSMLGDATIWRGGKVVQKRFLDEVAKFNGHGRIYLGNHDHFPIKVYAEAFEKVYATWRSEEGFICSHIPIHPRSLGRVTANVHGHIHQNATFDPVVFEGKTEEEARHKMERRVVPYINVSVEAVNYRPIHLDEILQRIRTANESQV